MGERWRAKSATSIGDMSFVVRVLGTSIGVVIHHPSSPHPHCVHRRENRFREAARRSVEGCQSAHEPHRRGPGRESSRRIRACPRRDLHAPRLPAPSLRWRCRCQTPLLDADGADGARPAVKVCEKRARDLLYRAAVGCFASSRQAENHCCWWRLRRFLYAAARPRHDSGNFRRCRWLCGVSAELPSNWRNENHERLTHLPLSLVWI